MTKTDNQQSNNTDAKEARVELKRPLDSYPFLDLRVSDIAQQAYCEKQVDLWLKAPGKLISVPAGMEETMPAKAQQELVNTGSRFHEQVSQYAEPSDWQQIEQQLKEGLSLTILESALEGSFQDILIVGKPDAICFEGWKAAIVLEYKVTSSTRLFLSQKLQLLLYGYLLEQRSFQVDSLQLVCAQIPRQNQNWLKELSPAQAEKLIDKIKDAVAAVTKRPHKNSREIQIPSLRIDKNISINLWVFQYQESAAIREIQFYTRYWLGKRAPAPANNVNKCQRCLYNAAKLCDVAAAAYRDENKS